MQYLIMLDNLKPEVQKEILKAYNANTSEELNLDIFPLAVLEIPTREEVIQAWWEIK